MYAVERLQELAPKANAAPIRNLAPLISQRTAAFDALGRESSEITPRKLAAARNLEMPM